MSNSKSPSLKGSIYGSCTLIKTDLIDQNPGKRGEQLDLLQDTIGSFGRWQFKISFLMALLKFPIAWFQLGIIFLAPPIGYWCKPPKEYQSLATDIWLNVSKPFINGTHQNDTEYCSMMDVINGTPSNIPCPFGYQYNTTVFTSSIQTEWDLVCKRARLVDLTQITLMFGVLIGNIVFGVAADRIGRKKVLMICIVFQSIFGFLAALSPWYWGFVISRFLLAICNGGIVIASFVMCMEVVGGVWRTIVPILYQIPYGLGNSLMGGLAYFFRSWRHLQLVLAGLSALYIFYAWIIPESPRWLMAVGKKKEATEVLEKAANYNKMDPDTIKATLKGYRELEDAKEKPKLSVIFVNKTLRTRTILLSVNWLICGITFYAFNQYLGHIGHNLFLTVGVSGFVALPGTLFCVYIVGKCGRRWTISCAHMLIAACFLMILFIPKGVFRLDWPRVGFAGLGVVGLSIAMPALYLFTGELYPTVIRNAGVGGAVMSSRVGSMLAPLVAALHDVAPFLPLLVMSALTFSLAVLVLFLPETKGKQLPERIEDLETENLDIRNGNYITVSTKEEEMVGERGEEEAEEKEEGRDIGKAEEVY